MTGSVPERRVYAVSGVPPEIQAYAMAKYSRSSQGMLESIAELSQQKAEHFLETFYFQYGHRSIADLAHLVFGIEHISLLAAIALVDEQVWDGQERSTRYQPFRATGWYTPKELKEESAISLFDSTAESLFTAYEQMTASLLELLVDSTPRPPSMPEGAYRRTLRARAFDVGRTLLPLATRTSVGQIVSARVAERQITRLLSSRFEELQEIGAELKQACRSPAATPLDAAPASNLAVAPTLVKYAEASPFQERSARALADAARTYLRDLGPAEAGEAVTLAARQNLQEETVTTLLYRHDQSGRSYAQIAERVADMREGQQAEIMALSLESRGAHDELPREYQAGYSLIFDVLVDLGAFRDLHRHRRCVQVQQPLTWDVGFSQPEDVLAQAFGASIAEAALEAGLGEAYEDTLLKAKTAAATIASTAPQDSPGSLYLLPLAQRTRCLFKMDWAEAAYIIEQRTAPAGHFSYRRVAWQMYQRLKEQSPGLAATLRATDPAGPLDLLDR